MWRLSHLKILLETVEVCNSVLQRNRTNRRYIDRWWVDRSIHRCIDEYDYTCRIVIYCQSEYCVSLTIPRKGLQTLLPAASWYWSNQGKHNAIKHWMEQVFTHTEKRQSRFRSDDVYRSLMVRGSSPPQLMQGNWPPRTCFLPH